MEYPGSAFVRGSKSDGLEFGPPRKCAARRRLRYNWTVLFAGPRKTMPDADTSQIHGSKPRGRSLTQILAVLGPGVAVAATGIGAGDMVSASLSGARFGTTVLWVVLTGALLKFVLNEGIARWQLATDTTLLEGWARHLHRGVLYLFGAYLLLWSFMVAAAQIAACGLAGHALVPALSVPAWGVIHSIVAIGLVWFGRYGLFERTMKFFIALMFVTVLVCAVLARPDLTVLAQGLLSPAVPEGGGAFLLGVVGGVGGSVTVMSYSYWMQEAGWRGRSHWFDARLDLGAAYLLTGLFGAAMVIIAAEVRPEAISGNEMVLSLAERIGELAGPTGRLIFLVGFWGAVFTSIFGVWQGVPYLFADTLRLLRGRARGDITRGDGAGGEAAVTVSTQSMAYRGYLLYMGIVPMIMLLVDRPVWVVLIYTISGAFFMPFLAATLLFLNNGGKWVGGLRNGWLVNAGLVAALVLFGYLFWAEVASRM